MQATSSEELQDCDFLRHGHHQSDAVLLSGKYNNGRISFLNSDADRIKKITTFKCESGDHMRISNGKSESLQNISSDDDDNADVMDEKRNRSEETGTDGGLSDPKAQDSVDKRRERNRLLARKTRQRKKVFYEALQRQVAQLVKENEILRGIVQTKKMSDKNHVLPLALSEDPSTISIPTNAVPGIVLEKADYRLVSAIQASQRAFVITNPGLQDNPIIFASKGFLDLTRYRIEHVLGKNCRFLQGPGTDKRQVDALRKGILCGVDTTVTLLNYRADGTTFYNQVFVAPLRDKNHKIVNYVGILMEVEVQLIDVAATKKMMIPVKAEKKDCKDEEADHLEQLDYESLETLKAPMKPQSNKRRLEEEPFDFDDFL
uniref:Putative LOV domain-containing protein n=1 Tax=Mallomonas sp. BC-2016 TaxID=1802913 RepID=A0A126WVP0_9STRA|nr:putative LOV domain-containing protein [Mallomonas sp. BC-2016]